MCGLFLCCLVGQVVNLGARNNNFCLIIISDEKLVKKIVYLTIKKVHCVQFALHFTSNIVSHFLFLYRHST